MMNKMKTWSLLAVLLMLATLASACAAANQDARQDDAGQQGDVGMNAARNGRNGFDGFNVHQRFRNDYVSEQNNNLREHRNQAVRNSQFIAEQIADIDGIDSASVLLTDRNAYVAVKQSDAKLGTADLSDGLKTQVADKVMALKPEILNVYVSANPDFADRIRGYADELEQGEPIEGMLEELNTLVDRIFPRESSRMNNR